MSLRAHELKFLRSASRHQWGQERMPIGISASSGAGAMPCGGAQELLRGPGERPSGRSGGDRRDHEGHDPRPPRSLSKRRRLGMPELVTLGQRAHHDADRAASPFRPHSDVRELLGRGRASAGAGCPTGRVTRRAHHAVASRRRRHSGRETCTRRHAADRGRSPGESLSLHRAAARRNSQELWMRFLGQAATDPVLLVSVVPV